MYRKPKSILDLGIGFGIYGFLARNYGVVWGERKQERYDNWQNEIKVDGIEIYEPLVTELHRMVYNNIFIGDAFDIAPDLPDYDLYIMGDFIEHLEKDKAIELIEKLKVKGNLIITTPDYWHKGEAVLGNEYEQHKCWMKDENFPDNPAIVHVGNQKVVVYE